MKYRIDFVDIIGTKLCTMYFDIPIDYHDIVNFAKCAVYDCVGFDYYMSAKSGDGYTKVCSYSIVAL